jgi:DNA-binding XRE family transcriptional regulator
MLPKLEINRHPKRKTAGSCGKDAAFNIYNANNPVANAVKSARSHGLTDVRIAKEIGVSRTTIYDWCKQGRAASDKIHLAVKSSPA